jgi:membrane protein implicated in regulation of membrane protease activity
MPFEIWWIWMILAVILVVGEIFTAGFFLLWFGIGAFVAGLLALIGLNPVWQVGAFAVMSGLLFGLSRRFAERFSKAQPPGVGADRVRDMEGVVIEKIDNMNNTGRVRIGKEEWKAESSDDSPILVGKKVKVTGQEGAHLLVKEMK